MPIFEFSCRACGGESEMLVRANESPTCRVCGSPDLERLLSIPAVHSDSTHQLSMRAARRRDSKLASEQARTQREYELKHDD